MKVFLTTAVLGFLLCSFPLVGQKQNLDQLSKQVNQLIYSSKYDSAQTLVLDFLKREDLTDIELFHGQKMYAETIRSSGRPENAIGPFKLALEIARMLTDSSLYQSQINMSIAGCYFDMLDYEKAREYSKKSIQLSPDSSLSNIGHAANYLILGYSDFVDEDYSNAEKFFLKARAEYVKYKQLCELPLFYAKMAPLYNARGDYAVAMSYIDSSRAKSVECDIALYRILTESALYNMYLENEDYKAAIEKSEEISRFNQQMRFDEQRKQMQTVEKEFEKKLQQAEIASLREINEKNEIILSKQRQNLWIAIGAVVLMAVLVILLLMVNQRRKKVLTEREELNSQLEAKVVSRTSHLEEAYQRIREHSKALDNQNKKLTDFYHMITHNLRAPLGNMTMLVELISDSKNADKQKELVSNMTPVVDNLNQTVSELMEAIQLSSVTEETTEAVSFEEVFEEVRDILKPQIERQDTTITTKFEKAPDVVHPPKYLHSLFHNLLSNSLKYHSPERALKIEVETEKSNDRVLLKFSDNGIGIDLEKYGDQLFKVGKVFHHHPDAKGFGLYMTKMQVENCGGEIWIESAPDKGTTVFVRFKE